MCIRDSLKAIGSYSGNVAYCIEPGISLKVGQTMNKYDENYFNNLAANWVISGDEIRLFVGRILQYGYRGTISTSWRLSLIHIYLHSEQEPVRFLSMQRK